MIEVQLVSGTRHGDPSPGKPVLWLITTPTDLIRGERVRVRDTVYEGVVLAPLRFGHLGMIRVALRGRPRKEAAPQ